LGVRLRSTTRQHTPLGALGALLFHALIFAAALFTFHRSLSTPEDTHVVPVDLVTIADKTDVAAQAPQAEPEKMDRPQPPAPEPPPEPQMQDVEPAPEPPIPQFDVAKEKPKPVEKPQPTKKEMAQNFNSLLDQLTKPDKPVKTTAKAGPRVIPGVGSGNLMTADLADALRSQMYRCWSPPTGAPDARDLIVDFDLALNPDGTVGRVQMTPGTAAAAATNGYTRAASEAASRAVYQCQPYRLPADRYSLWREINPLRFDPRQMMGQ